MSLDFILIPTCIIIILFILNRENMSLHTLDENENRLGYYAIPYGPYYIWGATARIIKSFSEAIIGKL